MLSCHVLQSLYIGYQLQTPIMIAVKMEKWEYADVLVQKLGGRVGYVTVLFSINTPQVRE